MYFFFDRIMLDSYSVTLLSLVSLPLFILFIVHPLWWHSCVLAFLFIIWWSLKWSQIIVKSALLLIIHHLYHPIFSCIISLHFCYYYSRFHFPTGKYNIVYFPVIISEPRSLSKVVQIILTLRDESKSNWTIIVFRKIASGTNIRNER